MSLETTQEKVVKWPVWLKIGMTTSLVAITLAMAIVLTLTPLYRASLMRSGLEYGAAVASEMAQVMNLRVELARAGLVDVGRNLSDTALDPDARISRALLLVEGNIALDHAAIYDRDGKLIDVLREQASKAPAPPEVLPKTLLEHQAEQRFKGLSVEPGKEGAGRAPMLVAIERDGALTGYVYSQVELGFVQAKLQELTEARFNGRPESLLMVDWQGTILAAHKPERVGQREDKIPQVQNKTYEMVAAGVAEIGEYHAPDGESYLVAYQPLEQAPWAIVAQIPHKIAFAPLEQMRKSVLLVFIGSMFLALLIALLSARWLTRHVKQLVESAKALGERRFSAALPVQTGDELALVGQAIHAAAQEIERSEQQLIQEARVRSDLSRFLPGELVEKVVSQQERLALGGQRVQVTVLFADVVGFTELCEGLKPEDTVTILNELFTIMTEIVFRHQGTVDKFMGDCMMAFWGPPHCAHGHATAALEAAEEILSWLEIGNAGWQERFGLSIELAIGVNTGDAVLGNVGSESRMEYTVIGDTVNVAARLEAIARPQQILTTQATVDAADDIFDVVDIGQKQLAGHEQPVLIYEVRL